MRNITQTCILTLSLALMSPLVGCSPTTVGSDIVEGPQSAFDTSGLKGPVEGEPNKVMVLGTSHLSQMPDSFDPGGLEPLIDRLASWGPDRIAVENQPGTLCHYMRSFASRHETALEYYCFDPSRAGEITGLSVPEAVAELDQRLSDGIVSPTTADRKRLIALSLAAGDRASAMMHWLAIPQLERTASEELDIELVSMIQDALNSEGEVALIAAPLAARLRHSSITSMDNQATHMNSPSSHTREAYGKAIEAAWDNKACAQRLPVFEKAKAEASTIEGVETLYRILNASDQAKAAFHCDFGAAMNEPSEEAFGRRYLAYWETRNLRMAANIREAMGEEPGKKTLVIVGATHKGYLEHYLDQMHDVKVVSTDLIFEHED